MTHRDVEYEVGEHTYSVIEVALAVAVEHAIKSGKSTFDVLVFSEAGAEAFGGDDAVEQYREDPDASVFERFEFKCTSLGRVRREWESLDDELKDSLVHVIQSSKDYDIALAEIAQLAMSSGRYTFGLIVESDSNSKVVAFDRYLLKCNAVGRVA